MSAICFRSESGHALLARGNGFRPNKVGVAVNKLLEEELHAGISSPFSLQTSHTHGDMIRGS